MPYRIVYGSSQTRNRSIQDFLRVRFDSWAIPSEKEVKDAIRLLDIDGIWEFPDMWYSKPPPRVPDSLLDEPLESSSDEDGSDSGSNDDQDDEDDEDYEYYDDDDDDDNEGDLQVPSGLQCREKIRFSAAANAIRFLKRIPGQRIHLKNLVLNEDFDSVNDQQTHARGLAPFFKENPSLQIVRRVSMVDCIIGLSYIGPSTVVLCLESGQRIKVNPRWIKNSLSRDVSYWIKDALGVKDAGIPLKSLTLRLEAGSHRDFCTDLFQRIVHRDIVWHRAYKLLNARGIFHHEEIRQYTMHDCRMMRDEDFKAIDKLVNRTSGVLSADFNTGVSLDAQALANETKHLDGRDWVAKWRPWGRSLKQQIPPAMNYDKLGDVFEFRTEDGQLVPNPQST
ncbi:hypothetical protein FCIRC_11913 [Fusarium circinatum]|uniref:Uncharacterized protein n=1 Tax=Fusarium circinatum TaxID=48490 RepID=A0A8H5SWF1_FUSCI|nr:hypothetical protein FCIRC_11913 [Fusarium circinatum]